MRIYLLLCIALFHMMPAVAVTPLLAPANFNTHRSGFHKADNKKLSFWSAIKAIRQQKKALRSAGIFPERMELTEGFQWLPFFGSLFTLGLVALIMLFTAKDANALRWAGNGVAVIGILFTALALVVAVSGG